MARRLHDHVGLAAVLMRSYWSRGTSSLEEILAMLTEARDLGEELGNTEIRAEAMSWRVPAFVALCDLESARREVVVLREIDRADRSAVPHPRGRALRVGDRALRRAPGGGRRPGTALAGVEPPADRAGTRRAPTGSRCSASAASRGAWRSSPPWSGSWPATRRARVPGGRGSWRCWPSSGWRRRRGASCRCSWRTGSTRSASRSGWARSRTWRMPPRRSATRPWRRSSIPSSSRSRGRT